MSKITEFLTKAKENIVTTVLGVGVIIIKLLDMFNVIEAPDSDATADSLANGVSLTIDGLVALIAGVGLLFAKDQNK